MAIANHWNSFYVPRQVCAVEPPDELELPFDLAIFYVPTRGGRERNTPITTTHFTAAYQRIMHRAGRLAQVQGRLFYRQGQDWRPIPQYPAVAMAELSGRVAVIACDQVQNPNTWAFNYKPSSERHADTPLDFLCSLLPEGWNPRPQDHHMRRGEVWAPLAGQAIRADLPNLYGILGHPLFGAPEVAKEWLPAPSPGEAEDAACPHLNELFAPLRLVEAARAPLYAWLFGALYYRSLSVPRPILCVDSRSRAAGKTEVCRALQWILDRRDSPIELPRGGYGRSKDAIAASLADGRCVVLNNLEGYDLQDQFLVNLSTDGAPSINRKYDRDNTEYPGRLAVINGVYDAFSLSPDLLSRIWRVELIYDPDDALGVIEYAKEHRDVILAEAFAVFRAVPAGDYTKATRMAAFERLGARAYATFAGRTLDFVADRMRGMVKRSKALTSIALHSLAQTHPEVFQANTERQPPEFANVGPLQNRNPREGAAAMGYVYTASGWVKEDA
jgi:hypothetical protein